MSRELRSEHDQLKVQLDKELLASNIVIHPTAVAKFAERLKASRTKLEYALHMLDEAGDLQRLVREVVASVTLFKDDDKRMFAKVTTWLDNFTVEGGNPVGGLPKW